VALPAIDQLFLVFVISSQDLVGSEGVVSRLSKPVLLYDWSDEETDDPLYADRRSG
jgi:hypothetical protein